jgi:hypothetical protein
MPIATLEAGRDEILLHFTTKWNAGTAPIPLLLYDDKARDLPTNASYARITVKHNVFPQVTVGATVAKGGNGVRFRRFGIVTVQVFTISGDGLTNSDNLVDLALDAFEGEKTGLDRIEFRNARANEIGQDGPWFQTNVIAEFVYDRVK